MREKDVHLKGQLKVYMYWPVIMTVLLIAMNFWMYHVNRKAGIVMTVFTIIYAVIVGGLYFYNRSLILADMIQFSTQYKGIQNTHTFFLLRAGPLLLKPPSGLLPFSKAIAIYLLL